MNYEGGGIGEYMYWNSENDAWDTSACDEMDEFYNTTDGERRCVKMDCHLQESENFKLLGFFKEPNHAAFYEQLFKHQGVCIWDEDTYEAMQNMRELWPYGCTFSGLKSDEGELLFFDVRPEENANVTIGLYTDERCSVDYQGEEDIAEVLSAYSSNNNKNRNNGLTLGDLITYSEFWNTAMNVFKQCQPCKAYDLNAEYEEIVTCTQVEKNDDYFKQMYGKYWYYYKRYGEPDDDYYKARFEELYEVCDEEEEEQKHGDDYSNDDSKGHFICEDDAGYK